MKDLSSLRKPNSTQQLFCYLFKRWKSYSAPMGSIRRNNVQGFFLRLQKFSLIFLLYIENVFHLILRTWNMDEGGGANCFGTFRISETACMNHNVQYDSVISTLDVITWNMVFHINIMTSLRWILCQNFIFIVVMIELIWRFPSRAVSQWETIIILNK
jgi:hypothetical protein